MYYLYKYIYNMAYYVQHLCALIQDKLEIPNYVVPESYYDERLIYYQRLCIRQIRKNRTLFKSSNNLILTRNMNPDRVSDLNTIRGPNEALWFFNKNNRETERLTKEYGIISNENRIEEHNSNNNRSITRNINVDFQVGNITLLNFTGKTPKEIEQKLMNITLMRAIFDYLYFKLEKWKESRDKQHDFNEYKSMFGYSDGTRISIYENDRKMVQDILNDDKISKLVQGYYCSKVQLGNDEKGKLFHEEYCILQKFCFGMSKRPHDLSIDTFITTDAQQDSEGFLSLANTPPRKRQKTKGIQEGIEEGTEGIQGGGNPQQKLLENLIFDPNGIDKDPIVTFFKKYKNLITIGIDNPDEIDEVMLYIIDPYIREIVRTDMIEIIENRKQMNTFQTTTKIDIPHVFGHSIRAYGGKTKRYRKGVKKHRKSRLTQKGRQTSRV
jgi:hypothetical protein